MFIAEVILLSFLTSMFCGYMYVACYHQDYLLYYPDSENYYFNYQDEEDEYL